MNPLKIRYGGESSHTLNCLLHRRHVFYFLTEVGTKSYYPSWGVAVMLALIAWAAISCQSEKIRDATPLERRIMGSKAVEDLLVPIKRIEIDERFPIGDLLYLRTFASSDYLLIYDALAVQLTIIDDSGQPVREIGRKGDGPGEYRGVVAVDCGPENRIYLLEKPAALRKVKIFDATGLYHGSIEIPVRASNLRISPENERLILYDTQTQWEGNRNIHVFNMKNSRLSSFGSYRPPFKHFNVALALYLDLLAISGTNIFSAMFYEGHYSQWNLEGELLRTREISNEFPDQINSLDEFRDTLDRICNIQSIYCCDSWVVVSKMKNGKKYLDFFNMAGVCLRKDLAIPDHWRLVEVDEKGLLYFIGTPSPPENVELINPVITVMKIGVP